MPLTCNIDSRGKSVRLIMGLIFIIDGFTMLFFWALRTGSHAGWFTAIALIAAGGFMIFEAWNGWCALRAMGMKTRV